MPSFKLKGGFYFNKLFNIIPYTIFSYARKVEICRGNVCFKSNGIKIILENNQNFNEEFK